MSARSRGPGAAGRLAVASASPCGKGALKPTGCDPLACGQGDTIIVQWERPTFPLPSWAPSQRPHAMDYQNLVELHRRQAERLGPRPAVRFRRHGLYHDLCWQDYREQALACAAALADAGIAA